LAGPPLVKAATGEIIDEESLGGGEMHTSISGVADHLAQSDANAIQLAREAIRDLGQSSLPAKSQVVKQIVREPLYAADELNGIVPVDGKMAYDIREIIARIVDGSEFREFKAEYGKTIVTVNTNDLLSGRLTLHGMAGFCRNTRAYVSLDVWLEIQLMSI
jgi:3-methylcrotonyl-CoA carboxylase beta subunit